MGDIQTNQGTAPTAPGVGQGNGAAPSPGMGATATLANQHGAANANSTPEQRAKWRERWQRRKDRILGKTPAPSGSPGPVVPGQPPVGGSVPGPGIPGQAPGAPVPWTPNAVKPVFARLVPFAEKLDVQSLRQKAAKLNDPDFAALVASDAKWDDGAKRDLIDSGSEIFAEWMNEMGLDSIPERYVKFSTAVGVIYASRKTLAAKLDELYARKYGKEEPDATNATPDPKAA